MNKIISKLLNRCGMHQYNKYSSAGGLIFWDKSHPDYPFTYRFIKKTRIGKWLERRWTKEAHKRIGVNDG